MAHLPAKRTFFVRLNDDADPENGLDWLSASVGDYSGGILNSSVGVNFQLLKHLGVGLSYQYFRLDVDVDSNDWKGAAEINYRGPFLSLTTNW